MLGDDMITQAKVPLDDVQWTLGNQDEWHICDRYIFCCSFTFTMKESRRNLGGKPKPIATNRDSTWIQADAKGELQNDQFHHIEVNAHLQWWLISSQQVAPVGFLAHHAYYCILPFDFLIYLYQHSIISMHNFKMNSLPSWWWWRCSI